MTSISESVKAMDTENISMLVETAESEAIYRMHALPDKEQMEACKGSVMRLGTITAIRTDIFPGFSVSRVMGFTKKPGESDLDEIEKFYMGRNGIFALQIPPHLIDIATERLLGSRDYKLKNHWVRFVRDTSPIAGNKTNLEIREITTFEDAKIFAEMVTYIFEFPKEIDPIICSTVGKEGWKFFMAYDEDKPVATGCVFLNGEIAWNCFATTLPEYRGRGAQGALLSARIDSARQAGCRLLTTETHKDNASYRNMLRYGYKVLYERPNYVYGE